MTKHFSVPAPELAVREWFNTPQPLSLRNLRGRVVFLHTFQLLCPGCVSDALPQVKRIERIFGHTDLQIIGLHTVFEHHAAMTPVTLKAFIHTAWPRPWVSTGRTPNPTFRLPCRPMACVARRPRC